MRLINHSPPTYSRRSASITLLAILFLGLAGVLVAGMFSFMGVRQINHDAAQREAAFARTMISSLLESQPREQRSSVVWNDAVLQVRKRNEVFMRDNLGVWMQEYFGHDLDFIVDPAGTLIYAAAKMSTVPVDTQEQTLQAIRPLLAELYELVLEAADAEEAGKLSRTDIVDLEDGPAFISIVPIVPENDMIPFLPKATSLHVAVRHLNAALAQKVAQPFQLADAQFSTSVAATPRLSVPVLDGAARESWFSWAPDRPGHALARELAPTAAMVSLVCFGMFLMLAIRLNRTTKQLARSERDARHRAHHDMLTGLANRVLLKERMEQALQDNAPPAGVILVDLDAFKQVNDNYGHPMGDKLVQRVAARLLRVLDDGATVARLGGDEFAIIVPDVATEDDLAQHCRRIDAELSEPFRIDGHYFQITASMGAVHSEACTRTKDEMIRCADIALYRSKNGGRAQFTLYHGSMDDADGKKNRLAADLAVVLTNGGDEITVQYQPIFDRQGALLGAEALARWHHPDLGEISPEVFVALAEERGLIEGLGRTVLAKACRAAMELALPKVSVNVSALEISRAGYSAQVLAVLSDHGLPPSRLELELTERTAINRRSITQKNITALREVGVTIALDDFGTGHSSIRYLREFGFDRVKIDKSFVQQLDCDATAMRLVHTMIEMASSLGIDVTAEGVEQETQLVVLTSLGCTSFQGYHLGRPMNAEALARLRLELESPSKVTYLSPPSRSIA
ncbi:putative bifunctional diguanylate cyclase/phosphodiesterase [Falsirhodobacter deserti]|uniref:putative bifunctional diguanylate cyclase/phosphodiesterase n=1 Tax=Falsirhodobacter deserti TaxID=1365611 RepID=UPI000FE344A5|nr:EAL domain-containing protein [Falsirhodobacter deserti]